ncbi:hypothetical protein [Gemmata obscuriglobus]|uniref:hypothetical protein n=1 Tax=Gemmata obscuriglobus TaxID=114 RepID=UPI0012FB2DF2|nr:hypothetical protein [Gemmata obscuriglobus]
MEPTQLLTRRLDQPVPPLPLKHIEHGTRGRGQRGTALGVQGQALDPVIRHGRTDLALDQRADQLYHVVQPQQALDPRHIRLMAQ